MKTLKRIWKLYWPMLLAIAVMYWCIWGLKGNWAVWFLNDELNEIACYTGLVLSGIIGMLGVAAIWKRKANALLDENRDIVCDLNQANERIDQLKLWNKGLNKSAAIVDEENKELRNKLFSLNGNYNKAKKKIELLKADLEYWIKEANEINTPELIGVLKKYQPSEVAKRERAEKRSKAKSKKKSKQHENAG